MGDMVLQLEAPDLQMVVDTTSLVMASFSVGESFLDIQLEQEKELRLKVEEGMSLEIGLEQGPPGAAGAPGTTIPPIEFAYGDAPSIRWTAPYSGLLTYVRLIIRVGFDGASPAIEVGVNADPGAALPSWFNDPTVVQEFENTPDIQMLVGDTVTLTISPGAGATQGRGLLLLVFLPT